MSTVAAHTLNQNERIDAHVPALISGWLQQSPNIETPAERYLNGTVLYADICGFTRLTQQVAQQGPMGVEALPTRINGYLSELIEHIVYHGGDVVKFAGDAVLVLWPDDDERQGESLRRAVQCALALTETVRERSDDPDFGVHIGIATGEVRAMLVGDPEYRYELLLAGPPIIDVGHAMASAEPGEVVVTQQAWTLLSEEYEGRNAKTGVVVTGRTSGYALSPRPLSPPKTPDEQRAVAQRLVAPHVVSAMAASGGRLLAEIRKVTTVFIGLDGIDYSQPSALEALNRATREIQSTFAYYDGVVDRIIMDDKGTYMIGVFGIPSNVHEDDETRAILSALQVEQRLARVGVTSSSGIATGRVFCGTTGDGVRCEYAVVGPSVNLACRLMQANPGRVCCEEVTRAAVDGFEFIEQGALQAKGFDEPIAQYVPNPIAIQADTRGPLYGREPERAQLERFVADIAQGTGRVAYLRGEPGIGKSHLVNELTKLAAAHGCSCFVGEADRFENAAPYRVWRNVLVKSLELDLANIEQSRARVLARLGEDTIEGQMVSLLNDVLPLDFPSNDITKELIGRVRADNKTALLLKLLTNPSSNQNTPTIIVLEDGHWFDTASWLLCAELIKSMPGVGLVVTSRPTVEIGSEAYEDFRKDCQPEEIPLRPLEDAAALQIAHRTMDVDELAPEIAQMIVAKGMGNPLFIRVLSLHIRDAAQTRIVNRRCVVESGDIESLSLPEKIEDFIGVRIGALSESQRTTLKIAAIVGAEFDLATLHAMHPTLTEQEPIRRDLAKLEQQELIGVQDAGSDVYAFQHALIHDVVYNLMTFRQRSELHAEIARWFEARIGVDQAPYYSLLANHYASAQEMATTDAFREEVSRKAIEYLEKAGMQAMLGYANSEAVNFLGRALTLVREQSNSDEDALRLAHWERLVGEAHLRLGHLHQSLQHLERSVSLSDRQPPRWRAGMVVKTIAQVLVIFWRTRFGKEKVLSEDNQARYVESARAYELLSEIHYFSNEPIRVLAMAVRGLYLVQRAAPCPERARLYANMSIVAGSVPVTKVARACSRTALQTVQSFPNEFTLAFVLGRVSVFLLGIGAFDEARGHLRDCIEITDRLNARRQLGEANAVLANVEYHSGNMPVSVELYRMVKDLSHACGDIQQFGWAANGEMENQLRLAEPGYQDLVRDSALELQAALAQNLDDCEQLRTAGVLAMVELRTGDIDAARSHTVHALRLSEQWYTNFASFEGHGLTAEALIRLWEHGAAQGRELPNIREDAAIACKALDRYAKHFPIGEARAHLWNGVLCDLKGQPRRAEQHWTKGLAAAERLNMRYEQGLIHLEMGLRRDGQLRDEHLRIARPLLEACNARYDVERFPAEHSTGGT